MIEIKNFQPRTYQTKILETAIKKNTLVVIPTGMGKTAISMLLALNRLKSFKDSKILLLAPTKPLCNQHIQTFIDNTTIPQEKILLLTGAIKPDKRKELWQDSLIIVATPQTIQKDLEKGRISLKDFSMHCIDECNRSRLRFTDTQNRKK